VAIEVKSNNDRLKLKRDFNNQTNALTLQLLDIDTQQQLNRDNTARDNALNALDKQFSAGLISQTKYNKERLNIEKPTQ